MTRQRSRSSRIRDSHRKWPAVKMVTSGSATIETRFSEGPIDPLPDVGPERPSIRRKSSRARMEGIAHDGEFPSEGPIIFWAYLILIIITIIGAALLIKNQLRNPWINRADRTGFPSLPVFLVLFVTALIPVLYASYHGHVLVLTDNYRHHLVIIFILEMILLIIWAVLFFKFQDPRNAAFIGVLIALVTGWWIWLLWPLNKAIGIWLFIYLAWWIYLSWASWNLAQRNNL